MDELTICWSITTKCNMRCWYCFSRYENKQQIDMNDTLVDYTLYRLKKISENVSLRVVLLGGEPTLYGRLYDVSLSLLNYCRKVIVVTNGTNLCLIHSLPKDVSIDLSYHGEDVDEFMKKVCDISSFHYVQVLCVLDTKHIDRCISVYKKCCDMNVYCEIIPIVDNESERALCYSPDIISIFKEKPIYYKNDSLFGLKTNIELYKENSKNSVENKHMRVCKQTNLALYHNGIIYPCCKTGQLEHRKYIYDDNAFRYIIPCQKSYCMNNRGCIDMAGWRQDPDGRFFSGNNK